MARYTYLAADLVTGAILCELPLTGVRFTRALNDAGTISATLPLGDPRVAVLNPARATEPARTVIYVDRDGVLVGDYIIWASNYDSGDPTSSSPPTLTIGGADPLSYFDHRKILPLLPPIIDTSTTARQQLVYTNQDRNAIARGLVQTAQSHTGGNIGVQLDASTSGVLDSATYNGFQMTMVGQALRTLAGLSDGPDFYFDITYVSGTPTRSLRIGRPRLGTTDNSSVFELGANLLRFTLPRDGSAMATRFFGVGDGMDADTPIALVEQAGLYAQGWPLLEDNASISGQLTPAQLIAYAAAEQAARSAPVLLPQLTINGSGQPTLGQFGLGDNIRMIVPPGADPYFGDVGADQMMRLISWEVIPGDDQLEQILLTVSSLLELT